MEHRTIHDIHSTWGTTRRCIASVAILFLNIASPSLFYPSTSGYWVPECLVSDSPYDERENGETATDRMRPEHCKGILYIAAHSSASYSYM